jgi:putative ABC transport system permease protein
MFPGLRVSSNFFRTLGVQPAMGRDFQPYEELPGQAQELILSDAVWHSRFGADRQIIGRTLRINGQPFTVVGVTPEDFHLPVGTQWGPEILNNAPQPLMFRPLGFDVSRADGDGMYNYMSIVRLKPGTQPVQATTEFRSSIADFERRYNIGLRPTLLPLREIMTPKSRTALWLLLGTVAAVLLIACVNVGNLMLVRTASRDREAGIRIALGSSRGELFRLVLCEALIVVALGCALGTLLAYAGLKAFVAAAPLDLPRIGDVRIDVRVIPFAAIASLVCTLICGLLPAWRLSRTDPHESLKAGSTNATEPGRKLRLREFLVSAEVAICTVLLVVGGLLLLSFDRVLKAPKGFMAAHVITQDIALGAKYPDEARTRFVDEALGELASIPGVESVGATNQLPLRGETWLCDLRDMGPPGRPGVGPANFRFVSPGYWRAMGIPLLRGRAFETRDRTRGIAVLSERAARALWPGQDPIGKHVGGCGGTKEQQPLEVVGVVNDVRTGAEKEAPFTVYQPYWSTNNTRFSFAIRTPRDPIAVMEGVRRVLRSRDGDLVIPRALTMDQILDESVALRRLQTKLAAAFAASALVLASLGIYGVIAFNVARRTPEIGIRIALGARRPQLAAMVVRNGMRPVIWGLAAGLGLALAGSRWIASQLFVVAPNDPWALSGVTILLLAVALGACWIPARRAMRVDPLRALRFE